MNKAFTTMVAGALIAGAAVTATAQAPVPTGLSVRFGLFTPTSATAQQESASWVAGGIDYKLKALSSGSSSLVRRLELSLSLDYAGKGDFRSVPLILNVTFFKKGPIYAFAGPGIGFVRHDLAVGDTEDKTEFAYDAGVGITFSDSATPIFVEAKWMGSGLSDLNGFGFFTGFRF